MPKSYDRRGIFAVFKAPGGLFDSDGDEYETFGLFMEYITGVPGPYESGTEDIFERFNGVGSCGDISTITMCMFYGAYELWKEAKQPERMNE